MCLRIISNYFRLIAPNAGTFHDIIYSEICEHTCGFDLHIANAIKHVLPLSLTLTARQADAHFLDGLPNQRTKIHVGRSNYHDTEVIDEFYLSS